MKIGITGTREGMNPRQRAILAEMLKEMFTPGDEFHHGDCKGVDVQAAKIAKDVGYVIVCHPPKSTETQGFFGGDIVHPTKGYLERDRAIVDCTDILIVVPLQDEWQPKGGTWYTYDYAVKKKKPVKIVYPNPKGLDAFQ